MRPPRAGTIRIPGIKSSRYARIFRYPWACRSGLGQVKGANPGEGSRVDRRRRHRIGGDVGHRPAGRGLRDRGGGGRRPGVQRVPGVQAGPGAARSDAAGPGRDRRGQADPRRVRRADRDADREERHRGRGGRPRVRRRRLRDQAVQAQGAGRPGARPAAPRGRAEAGDARDRGPDHRRGGALGQARRRADRAHPARVRPAGRARPQALAGVHPRGAARAGLVQRLRSKIEHDPEKPEIVITVRGVGYKAGPA